MHVFLLWRLRAALRIGICPFDLVLRTRGFDDGVQEFTRSVCWPPRYTVERKIKAVLLCRYLGI